MSVTLGGGSCFPGGAQLEHLHASYNAVGWKGSMTGKFNHVLKI
jgi:hypothetical protein